MKMCKIHKKCFGTNQHSQLTIPHMQNTINLDEIVNLISVDTGATKKLIKEILDKQNAIIKQSIKDGDTVKIYSYWTFSSTTRKARVGVNPKTLEKVAVPTKLSPKISFSKPLKDYIAS